MSTVITTIQPTDQITNSRTDLNNNFASLNTNKIETSVIDTDPSLTANSDANIPSQKAVKAYVDAGGNVNASTSSKGIVQEATSADVVARTGTGSTGARLFVNPSVLSSVLKFGGTGADGALSISSGTTNIDLAGARVFIKNYTSISITGSAAITFTNPHASGTLITFKSQGAVTITSAATRGIDLRLLGANAGVDGSAATSVPRTSIGLKGGIGASVTPTISGKTVPFFTGAGGGAGNNIGGQSCTPGSGGKAGGGLYIECGGALNITSTIDASGGAGINASGSTIGGGSSASFAPGGGAGQFTGTDGTSIPVGIGCTGGAGGGGGSIVIVYTTLTANTGTYTVTGGTAGTGIGSSSTAGNGGDGYAFVIQNTEFV